MNKRVLALVLALVMLLGTFTVISAEEAAAPAPEVVSAKVQWLVNQGLIVGDAGGLRLNDELTRAEMARVIVVALQKTIDAEAVKAVPSSFKDVPATHWANGSINVAKAAGFISGYADGTFKPDQKITNAEVMAMLVRVVDNSPAVAAELSRNWPVATATLASSKNVLKDIATPVVTENTKRGVAFEMLANVLNIKNVGEYEIVKAIVLENNRTNNRIAKDEVMFEVIKVLQTANFVSESRKAGDQMAKVIEAKVGDVENLLGKVVDFKMDKNGKVVEATVDTSYDYVAGTLKATERTLKVGTKTYSVLIDERYNKNDERVFRTYVDAKGYSYLGFAKDFEKEANLFGRVTIKNGRVLFVDGYKITDIAPVEKVERDGANVYFYNDVKNGRVDRIAKQKYTIEFTAKYGFKVLDPKNVKANDVIHLFANGMIVRTDAAVTGELKNTVGINRNEDQSVIIGEEEIAIDYAKYFAPVYSYDKDEYRTLVDREELKPIKGKEVLALKDIFDNLQLINSDVKINDQIVLVKKVLSKGAVEFLPAKGDTFRKSEDWATKYYTFESNDGIYVHNIQLNEFFNGSLAYLLAGEENIEIMAHIPHKDVSMAEIVSKYVTLHDSEKHEYRYDEHTVFFATDAKYDGKDTKFNTLGQIGDLDKFVKANKDHKDLQAYVISDKEMRDMLEKGKFFNNKKVTNLYHRISDRDDIANVVVFFSAKEVSADRKSDDYAIVLDTRGYRDAEIKVQLPDGEKKWYELFDGLNGAKVDDVVILHELKKVEEGKTTNVNPEVVIEAEEPAYKVLDKKDKYGYKYALEVEDKDGNQLTVFVDKDSVIFGDSKKYIQLELDSNKKDVLVGRYTSKSYWPEVAPSPMTLKTVDVDNKEVTIEQDGKVKVYKFNDATKFFDKDGNEVATASLDTLKDKTIEVKLDKNNDRLLVEVKALD